MKEVMRDNSWEAGREKKIEMKKNEQELRNSEAEKGEGI